MAGVVLAFLVGVSVGILIGRRSPAAAPEPAATTPAAAAPLAASPRIVTTPVVPNKRARKLGLTEEVFTPSDDILEKLRLAAEGAIDPAELAGEPERPPPPPPEPALPDAPELTEAERRVLDRLRRGQAEGSPDDPSALP